MRKCDVVFSENYSYSLEDAYAKIFECVDENGILIVLLRQYNYNEPYAPNTSRLLYVTQGIKRYTVILAIFPASPKISKRLNCALSPD